MHALKQYYQRFNAIFEKHSAWQHWEINAVVFDKCGFSGLLMTDLLKTFDCIDHVVLIAKMHAYGFDIKPLKLKFKI